MNLALIIDFSNSWTRNHCLATCVLRCMKCVFGCFCLLLLLHVKAVMVLRHEENTVKESGPLSL